MKVAEHLAKLGHKAKDRVTGFEGVASSICFDLYGCIQVSLTPGVDKDGKRGEVGWFDISRLDIIGDPVMQRPNYDFGPIAEGRQGAAEKPAFTK